MPDHDDPILDLLRAVSASPGITFGTTVPYAMGRIYCERIGFADIPVVTAVVTCPERDIDAVVLVVRQRVYGWLAERGVDAAAVSVRASLLRQMRLRMFEDENESSSSYGRRKRGCQFHVHFEMTPTLRAAVSWRGSYGTLRAAWEVAAG